MKRFKFFVLDFTGRIDRGFEHVCRDAADAVAFAKLQTDAVSVEIWHDGTMIEIVRIPRRVAERPLR